MSNSGGFFFPPSAPEGRRAASKKKAKEEESLGRDVLIALDEDEGEEEKGKKTLEGDVSCSFAFKNTLSPKIGASTNKI